MGNQHGENLVDEHAEQLRERVAAFSEQRRRELAETYDRGWDEALDEARRRISGARDLQHADRLLVELAADGSTGPRQHAEPLGKPEPGE